MRILRLEEIMQMTGLGRSTIYRLMAQGKFPMKLDLGPRSVGWLESELHEWLQSKMTSRQQPE